MPSSFNFPVSFFEKMLKTTHMLSRPAHCIAAFALLSSLAGCVSWQPASLKIGDNEQSVISQLGAPSARIPDSNGYLLEYNRNPWGQATHMARFDQSGHLLSYEQVLTDQKFAQIKVNVATRDDVLRMIGHPAETSYLSRQQLEVWSYPYKESGTWNSVMHVHFDHAGIVRLMQNTMDLRFDRDGLFPFFGM